MRAIIRLWGLEFFKKYLGPTMFSRKNIDVLNDFAIEKRDVIQRFLFFEIHFFFGSMFPRNQKTDMNEEGL